MTRVLVVDDEDDLRTIVRAFLAREGYEITEARNGEEALATLDGEADPDATADLVLLDLRMPVLDGWGVLEALAKDRRIPDLPVVVISAHVDDTAASRAVSMGCRAFLPKPFTRDELLTTVASALHRS